jgi:hypothetical protein
LQSAHSGNVLLGQSRRTIVSAVLTPDS